MQKCTKLLYCIPQKMQTIHNGNIAYAVFTLNTDIPCFLLLTELVYYIHASDAKNIAQLVVVHMSECVKQ